MLQSLVNAKTVIVENLSKTVHAELFATENSRAFWSDVTNVLQVLKPLARCRAVSEAKETSLGEAMKSILELGKSLSDSDWSDPLSQSTVTAYLNYINPNKLNNDEFGLFLTAYALDARYKQDHLTLPFGDYY